MKDTYRLSQVVGILNEGIVHGDIQPLAVENFGAGDVLEIEGPDGKRFMVPMTPQAVPEWGERVVIDGAFVV